MVRAFDLQDFQISGPAWIFSEEERFDIQATMPPDTTQDQLRTMLQSLLTERFNLVFHYETRKSDVYKLAVSKTGVKIQHSKDNPSADQTDGSAPAPPPRFDSNGIPIVSPEKGTMSLVMGRSQSDRLIGQGQTVRELANLLASVIGRPVSDGTGLSGRYDFALTYTKERATLPGAGVPESSDDTPSLVGAVKEQLGLDLKLVKGWMKILVIDHVERLPTEN